MAPLLLYWGCSKVSFNTVLFRYLNSLQYFYDCIHYLIAVAIGISIPLKGYILKMKLGGAKKA